MNLRGVIGIALLFLSCHGPVFAERTDLKTSITATSLKNPTGPITVMSDSILVKEQLKKYKSVKPKNTTKVMTPGKEVNAAVSNKNKKRAAEPEIIQLDVPEQMLKVVNTGKSFVFRDITHRDKNVNVSSADLIKKQQTIESLRQASVRR